MAKSPAKSVRFRPIGVIRSTITDRKLAPKQMDGAPDAWLDVDAEFAPALLRLRRGMEVVVLTWLHLGRRQTLQVHPRFDPKRRLHGVFATRSPDRPNPIGLHRVTIRSIRGTRLRIGPIEVVDGTPVLDIKLGLKDR